MPANQKDLWKAQILEFFHHYFIGISYLECSNPHCPLTLIWDQIEEKLSKKGKCAIVKIDLTKFLVVDILTYEINGLEEIVNVSIQYRDGKETLVRTKEEQEKLTENLSEEAKDQLSFITPEEVIYFFNNSSLRPNLENAEDVYLEDLWDIKEKIKWDRDKSKKKVFLHVENDPSDTTQAKEIAAAEKDYLFYIADPSTTNEIKKMEIYSPTRGTEERKQLHEDYLKDFSELRRVFGIRHLTNKKEDRQNNPEIELNEAQFIALERRKKRVREESISEWETRKWCSGKHTLTYGAWQERQEAEVEKIEEIKQEPDPIQKLERDLEKEKGGGK